LVLVSGTHSVGTQRLRSLVRGCGDRGRVAARQNREPRSYRKGLGSAQPATPTHVTCSLRGASNPRKLACTLQIAVPDKNRNRHSPTRALPAKADLRSLHAVEQLETLHVCQPESWRAAFCDVACCWAGTPTATATSLPAMEHAIWSCARLAAFGSVWQPAALTCFRSTSRLCACPSLRVAPSPACNL
jgi:hypothetical protein